MLVLETGEYLSVKKNVASLAIFTLLLLGMLSFAFNIKPAKAEWTGTVYIRADGRIDPPDAPIITDDNITYTLTGDVTSTADGIVVERDNIIIVGAGYTLQGTSRFKGKGIVISGRYNVTVKNINIQNFAFGIDLFESSNSNITGNNIANNGCGIDLGFSLNNSITGNSIANNDRGAREEGFK
jgi:parallel beta-helix repeat protein